MAARSICRSRSGCSRLPESWSPRGSRSGRSSGSWGWTGGSVPCAGWPRSWKHAGARAFAGWSCPPRTRPKPRRWAASRWSGPPLWGRCSRHLGGGPALPRVHVDTGRLLAGADARGADGRHGADLVDVRGQLGALRALEVAAAGGYNLLLVGPPGSGKTMLARRLPGILPSLCLDEALEVTKVLSVAGRLPPGSALMTRRPFTRPITR